MTSYHLLMSFASELAGAASLRNGCFSSSFAVARWFRFRTNALPRKSSSKSEAYEEDMDRLRKQVSILPPLCFVVTLMLLHLQHTHTPTHTTHPHTHPPTPTPSTHTFSGCLSLGGLRSRIKHMASRGRLLKYGGSPSTISITMMPSDQMST